MAKTKVLFLCTGNSARSQMAEAFLRQAAGDRFDVYSAGLEPKGINPRTRAVMKEVGLDLNGQWSKDVTEYLGRVNFGKRRPTMTKQTVLFLCTGNSCRSQMAEGLVNHLLGERWQAVSAGTEPSGYVHPLAVAAMAELDIDISSGRSKNAEEFRGWPLDRVITVCDDAAENCPLWLGQGTVTHHAFYDPAKAEGSLEERMAIFREVRDQIKDWVVPFLATL